MKYQYGVVWYNRGLDRWWHKLGCFFGDHDICVYVCSGVIYNRMDQPMHGHETLLLSICSHCRTVLRVSPFMHEGTQDMDIDMRKSLGSREPVCGVWDDCNLEELDK